MHDRDDAKVFACLLLFHYHHAYNVQYFKLKLALAFADVMYDVWFSGPKANSFKPDYIKEWCRPIRTFQMNVSCQLQ
jgi:hypothetical protein